MEKKKKEVNQETETLTPEVEKNVDDEEVVGGINIPPEEVDNFKKDEKKEEEEEIDEKEEEEEEVEESDPSTDTEPSKPKPVEGETAKERALRQTVTNLREKLREKRKSGMFSDIPKTEKPKDDDSYKKLRETYSDEEIRNMEGAIDIIAENKGYVKKGHDQQEVANDLLDDFVDQRDDYSSENDPEDVRRNMLYDRLESGIYNFTGANKKQLREIFRDADRFVKSKLGEVKTEIKTVNTKARDAKTQKIKSVSHTGGTKIQKEEKPSRLKDVTEETRGLFKGGDWDELFEEKEES